MKKNYYRLVNSDYFCVATYYGTKSNGNAYFRRFVKSTIPSEFANGLYTVLTYASYDTFVRSVDSIYISKLNL